MIERLVEGQIVETGNSEPSDIVTATEQQVHSRKKLLRWLSGRALFIAVPVLLLGVFASCTPDKETAAPSPTLVEVPTPDLGENNVPFVRIKDEDTDGDGDIDIDDAGVQRGLEWRARYDFNFDFDVNDGDELRLGSRICKLPVGRFDVVPDGQVNSLDLEAFKRNKGSVQSEPNANIRLDVLMGSRWDPDKMIVEFDPNTSESEIENFLDSRGYGYVYAEGDKTPHPFPPLRNDRAVTVYVQIPLDLLAGTNLGELMDEARVASGVIKVNRYSAFLLDDLNPRPDPACGTTPTPDPETDSVS